MTGRCRKTVTASSPPETAGTFCRVATLAECLGHPPAAAQNAPKGYDEGNGYPPAQSIESEAGSARDSLRQTQRPPCAVTARHRKTDTPTVSPVPPSSSASAIPQMPEQPQLRLVRVAPGATPGILSTQRKK